MSQKYFAPEWMLEQRLKIDVIGAGGTGSEVLDGLARMETALRALGHPGFDVAVWDGDEVSQTNVLRQRFLPSDVGLNKAITLVHRFNLFMGMQWTAIPEFFSTTGETQRRSRLNALVITCTDSARTRVEIGKAMRGTDGPWGGGSLWLDTGNSAADGQVVLGHFARTQHNALKLPNILELFPEMEDSADDLDAGGPSCGAEESLSAQEFPVNRQVATTAVTLLWNLLRHGAIETHGAFVNTRANTVSAMPIDTKFWSSMGYVDERLAA